MSSTAAPMAHERAHDATALLSIDELRAAAATSDGAAIRSMMANACAAPAHLVTYSAERAWRVAASFLREGEERRALAVIREIPPSMVDAERGRGRDEALALASRAHMRVASKALLDLGANPLHPDPEGMTAIMHFARNADAQLLDEALHQAERLQGRGISGLALIQTDRAHGWRAAMFTVASAASDTARRMTLEVAVRHGLKVDQGAGADGTRLVSLAAALGDASMIQILHKHFGADVKSPDARGFTPMMTACYSGSEDAVRALGRAGAPPDAQRAFDGATAAHLAAHRGHAPCIAALHELGANLRLRTRDSEETPADFARQASRTEVAAYLDQLAPPPQRQAQALGNRIKDLLAPIQRAAEGLRAARPMR